MTKQSLFKKLIKEACIEAIKQEFPKLIKEYLSNSDNKLVEKKTSVKESLQDAFGVPLTLNTSPKQTPKKIFKSGDVISDLLNETFISMTSDDAMNFNPGGDNINVYQEIPQPNIGSVSDMLKTARKSSNIEAIAIDTVPDFNNLMDKLINQGDIK